MVWYRWTDEVLGNSALSEMMRSAPRAFESIRPTMLTAIARAREAPPKPVAVWSVTSPYAGIEHAGLVLVNVRGETERDGGERLVADIVRLRKDRALFTAILSYRGTRTPITALVADITDPRDAGRRKALARAGRATHRTV